MTSGHSVLAPLVRFWSSPFRRWMTYAIVALVLAILSVFPRPEVGRAKILPQDMSSTGLNAVLNSLAQQDGVFAAFLSNRQAIDLYLHIARSQEVRREVAQSLGLVGADREYATMDKALVDLEKMSEVNSLTGGLIQIEVRTHDADEALKLTKAFTSSISNRIGKLGREQLSIKENVVKERFQEASRRVADSEAALDAFRKRAKLSANPEAELGAAIAARAGIEAQLKAKQVELQTIRKFAGPENYQLQSVTQEIATLQAQLSRMARPTSSGAGTPNTVALTESSGEYLALFRDYRYAQALFEVYSRFAEQIAVESFSADTAENVQIVEQAHVVPTRHFNVAAVALLFFLGLLVFVLEFYGPATGLIRKANAQYAG